MGKVLVRDALGNESLLVATVTGYSTAKNESCFVATVTGYLCVSLYILVHLYLHNHFVMDV